MNDRFTRLLCRGLSVLALAAVAGADWPHWMGPNYNGSSPETALLTTWPKGGPKVLWKVKGGDGYSSVAVVGGRAFTLVQRDNQEVVIALAVKNGQEVWARPIGPAYKNKFGDGPRSTPTVQGGRVYVQSVHGPVLCLDAGKGEVIWQKDLMKQFKGENIDWGLSASPRLDGDAVLVIPGAPGASVAALGTLSGSTTWKSGDDKAAYATPVVLEVAGTRQAIFFTATKLWAVDRADGKELWSVPWEIEFKVNICTPLVIGKRLFVSTGEKAGCALFEPQAKGPPKVIWEKKGPKSTMLNYWANAVVHGQHLYGLSGEYDKAIDLNCVELATGNLVWSRKKFGKGAITLAAGHLFITTKAGDLVLVEATPIGYLERARLVEFLGENRTVPTISGGKMFLRDREHIYCLDIAAAK
jgi:outer membrane protein assembly factor BamB